MNINLEWCKFFYSIHTTTTRNTLYGTLNRVKDDCGLSDKGDSPLRAAYVQRTAKLLK
jgi:hypothetical protein